MGGPLRIYTPYIVRIYWDGISLLKGLRTAAKEQMFSGGAFHELRTRQELQGNTIRSDKLENEGNEIASPLIFKRTL